MMRTGRDIDRLRKQAAGLGFFNAALEDFAASYQKLSAHVSLNICSHCLGRQHLELKASSIDLMAFGLCGQCGKIKRVCDLDLLKLYRAAGMSNSTILGNLPLLRQDFPTRPLLTEGMILALLEKIDIPHDQPGPPQDSPGGDD